MVDFWISTIDPMMKGVMTEDDVADLDEETQQHVAEIAETVKNGKGEIDFFCYLKTIKSEEGLPEKIKNYIERSHVWSRLAIDYYVAAA